MQISITIGDDSDIGEKIELTDKSWITRYPKIPDNLLMNSELFKEIWDLHPTEKETIKIIGKDVKMPRYSQSYGQSYYYSGKKHPKKKIEHSYLKDLLDWVRAHSGKNYMQILVNWYDASSGDYIGPHSDDEKQIVPNSSIYSFSFGTERKFKIHKKYVGSDGKKKTQIFKTIPVKNNSLVIMEGEMQKEFKHSVPKMTIREFEKAKNDEWKGRRINVTFRLFKE